MQLSYEVKTVSESKGVIKGEKSVMHDLIID